LDAVGDDGQIFEVFKIFYKMHGGGGGVQKNHLPVPEIAGGPGGDDFSIVPVLVLMVLSAAGMALLVIKRKEF
jgi:hypothetical protein